MIPTTPACGGIILEKEQEMSTRKKNYEGGICFGLSGSTVPIFEIGSSVTSDKSDVKLLDVTVGEGGSASGFFGSGGTNCSFVGEG